MTELQSTIWRELLWTDEGNDEKHEEQFMKVVKRQLRKDDS